jgi:hypothetical protein
MKKLINLLCRKTEIDIENKVIYRKELRDIHKLIKQAYELQAETRFVLDYIKKTNFKDIYLEEHERFKDLEKENRKLKKEIKQYEKDNNTTNN